MSRLISVIIPSYNASLELFRLILSIKKNLITHKFEIIIIEDNSTNKNTNLFKLIKKEKKVKIFFLKKNLGQHRAVVYGLSKSRGQYIFTLDDDMQHNPRLMIKMFNLIKKSDLIYAYPVNFSRGYFRFLFVKLMKLVLINIFLIKEFHYVSDFRLFKKSLINKHLQNKILKYNLNFFKLAMYTWCIIKTKVNLLYN